MDFQENLLKGLKEFLGSMALKNSASIMKKLNQNSLPPDLYSFEEWRDEDFQNTLFARCASIISNDEQGEKSLETGILNSLINSCEKVKPKCAQLYVEATSILVLEMNRGVTLPITYEVLLIIFFYSNQMFRQHHFHELLSHYYSILQEQMSPNSSIYPLEVFENDIKTLAPFAKLDVLYILYKYWNFDDAFTSINTLLLEMNQFILQPNLLREDCYKIVADDLETTHYKLLDYVLTPVEDVPGYLGDYYKLNISVIHNNETKCYFLFAKYFPRVIDEAKMNMVLPTPKKEAFIYRTFVPKLRELGLHGISDFSPKCYFILTSDVLILEDLSVAHYTSSNIATFESYSWLSIVIRTLAKFHACSLLLEEKLGRMTDTTVRLGDHYAEFLKEVAWCKEEPSGELNRCSIKMTIDYILGKFPQVLGTASLEQFKEKATAAFELLYEQMSESKHYRNVISHGDIWASNIMTRNENGVPDSCYIIDYQLIKYCPPFVDLLTFIYMHTNKETRRIYQQKLLDDYYETISDILGTYDMDINKIYSRDSFLRCCEEFQSTAICQALVCLQMLLLPQDILRNLLVTEEDIARFNTVDRTAAYDEIFKQDSAYKDRLKELVQDLYDVCEEKF